MGDFLRDHVDVLLRESLQIARSNLRVSKVFGMYLFGYG
jgi:hypothetical protein